MELAPDIMLAVGLVCIAAGVFVMLGVGPGLVAFGAALGLLGVIYARAGA